MRITCSLTITPAPDISHLVEIQGNDIIATDAKWIQCRIPEMIKEFFSPGIKSIHACITCSCPKDTLRRFSNVAEFCNRFFVQFVINPIGTGFRVERDEAFCRSKPGRSIILKKNMKDQQGRLTIFFVPIKEMFCFHQGIFLDHEMGCSHTQVSPDMNLLCMRIIIQCAIYCIRRTDEPEYIGFRIECSDGL